MPLIFLSDQDHRERNAHLPLTLRRVRNSENSSDGQTEELVDFSPVSLVNFDPKEKSGKKNRAKQMTRTFAREVAVSPRNYKVPCRLNLRNARRAHSRNLFRDA